MKITGCQQSRSLQDPNDTPNLEMDASSPTTAYWNDPDATALAVRDGWLYTGDLAYQDEDGYFWFSGRKKEIIIRGGSNISPQEVEEILLQHPAIFQAGVVGTPVGGLSHDCSHKLNPNDRSEPVNSIGRRNTSNLSEEEVGHGDVTDLVHVETEG